MYVADNYLGSVFKIVIATKVVTIFVPGLANPTGVVVDALGSLFVSTGGSIRQMSIAGTSSVAPGTITAIIPVDTRLGFMALAPRGGALYVGDLQTNRLHSVVGPFGYASAPCSTALWVGFAFFGVAAAVLLVLAYVRNVKPEARLTYYLATFINAVTALAYLLMASGATANVLPGPGFASRPFLWLRYAAWAFCGPVSVLMLGLLAGAHWVEILFLSVATLAGLAAAFAGAILSNPSYQVAASWALAAAGSIAILPFAFAVAWPGPWRTAAYRQHPEVGRLFDLLALSLLVLGKGYAVVWGVSEAGRWTTPDQEIIAYTVLDIATKVRRSRLAPCRGGGMHARLHLSTLRPL